MSEDADATILRNKILDKIISEHLSKTGGLNDNALFECVDSMNLSRSCLDVLFKRNNTFSPSPAAHHQYSQNIVHRLFQNALQISLESQHEGNEQKTNSITKRIESILFKRLSILSQYHRDFDMQQVSKYYLFVLPF